MKKIIAAFSLTAMMGLGFFGYSHTDVDGTLGTEDKGEKDVIVAYKTAEGNHSREKYSERQIDVIKNEVIPKYIEDNINTGIIAPYKNQVKVLQDKLPSFEVATVHKFQGREKDTIILSTVDDEVSDFVDNPNLLNVAI